MDETVNIPLSNFQQWMQQMLLDPYQQTGVDPISLLPNASNVSSLEDIVHHSEKITAQEHFRIYQRSYILRLRNCMAQQFSALEYALGEDIFCAFADEYLVSRPSYNYNLSFLGAHFSEYIEANRPDAEENEKENWVDFMIELAKFEYSIGVIFEENAEEDYQLADENSPEEKLKLVPVCELFKFQFPVQWYYTEFKKENNPSLPYGKESYCVVLRHKFKLAVYDVHKEQYEFLTSLKQGMDIAMAKSEFKENHKADAVEFERVWSSWKKRWIEAKIFRI
jgi:hypothetical protein